MCDILYKQSYPYAALLAYETIPVTFMNTRKIAIPFKLLIYKFPFGTNCIIRILSKTDAETHLALERHFLYVYVFTLNISVYQ